MGWRLDPEFLVLAVGTEFPRAARLKGSSLFHEVIDCSNLARTTRVQLNEVLLELGRVEAPRRLSSRDSGRRDVPSPNEFLDDYRSVEISILGPLARNEENEERSYGYPRFHTSSILRPMSDGAFTT